MKFCFPLFPKFVEWFEFVWFYSEWEFGDLHGSWAVVTAACFRQSHTARTGQSPPRPGTQHHCPHSQKWYCSCFVYRTFICVIVSQINTIFFRILIFIKNSCQLIALSFIKSAFQTLYDKFFWLIWASKFFFIWHLFIPLQRSREKYWHAAERVCVSEHLVNTLKANAFRQISSNLAHLEHFFNSSWSLLIFRSHYQWSMVAMLFISVYLKYRKGIRSRQDWTSHHAYVTQYMYQSVLLLNWFRIWYKLHHMKSNHAKIGCMKPLCMF